MTDAIIWKDAPEPKRGVRKNGKYAKVFEALRANPGKTALLAEGVYNSLASTINAGKTGGAKPGEFKAVSRKSETVPDRWDIYVTYVGEEN